MFELPPPRLPGQFSLGGLFLDGKLWCYSWPELKGCSWPPNLIRRSRRGWKKTPKTVPFSCNQRKIWTQRHIGFIDLPVWMWKMKRRNKNIIKKLPGCSTFQASKEQFYQVGPMIASPKSHHNLRLFQETPGDTLATGFLESPPQRRKKEPGNILYSRVSFVDKLFLKW